MNGLPEITSKSFNVALYPLQLFDPIQKFIIALLIQFKSF